jgi:hypothetical protein
MAGENNPNADPSVYQFVVIQTGEVIAATKTEIRQRFGIKSASLCAIFSGRRTQTGGICLADAGNFAATIRSRREWSTGCGNG